MTNLNPTLMGPDILELGDARLRQEAARVTDFASGSLDTHCQQLKTRLSHFRKTFGWGRAIAAPQIGIPARIIAMDLGKGPHCLINPEIIWTNSARMSLWDDCMSFPWLMVKLQRWTSISVRYQDEQGDYHVMKGLDPSESELLQHEIDHLDGVLAVDHALDSESLVSRAVFEAAPQDFYRQVDWFPGK